MKIIAHANKGYIIEASKGEVEALLGKTDGRRTSTLDIGTELSFTIALTNLNLLRDLKLNDSYRALYELKKAKEEVDKAVLVLESTNIELIKVQKTIIDQQL